MHSATQIGSVAAALRSLPQGAKLPALWRDAAFALLRLNPREAEALAGVFEDESVADDTRQHVLDLLAGAGTFETQVVMRRLLALSVARRESRTFARFVQRLAILEQPDGPTLRFLMSVFAESKNEPHDVRAACAYALGASAGQAFRSGDGDAAVRACDVLRKELFAAGKAQERCALVTALGNAGLPGDAAVVLRFADDPERSVRAAAALALRKISTTETRAKLIALLADRDLKVAQSAVVALADHALGDEELDLLAEMVLGGRTALALDTGILGLVVSQRARFSPTPSRPGSVENALRLLLGRADASGRESGERGAIRPPQSMPSLAPSPAPAPGRVSARAFPAHAPPPATHPPAWPSAAAPVPGPLPYSGQYRIVQPGDSVEQVRERMEQLGLNPHARTSLLPPPPPRKENLASTVMANPQSYAREIASSAKGVSPNAVVRRAR